MSRNLQISLGLVVLALLGVVGLAITTSSSEESVRKTTTAAARAQAPVKPPPVVRANSHRLSRAENSKVTLVEFLDFECEACGALYPAFEDIRKQYDGRVNFVIRYFPLPGHRNGRLAAQVVEAAARQGRLEAMYKRMYETQAEWGESQESQRKVFVGFARDIGLDMKRFARDVDAEATAARVQQDVDDGLALGVESTPTLFLNGELLRPESLEQLIGAIDTALAAT